MKSHRGAGGGLICNFQFVTLLNVWTIVNAVSIAFIAENTPNNTEIESRNYFQLEQTGS